MSRVAIEKVNEPKSVSLGQLLRDRIRERAWARFMERGCTDGHALDDWLRAENDVMQDAESELIESDCAFELNMNIPGFEPGEVHVTAAPDALVVSADSSHTTEVTKEGTGSSERIEKSLFRQFGLPCAIDVDHVTAKFDKGVLKLVAAKAQSERPFQKATAA